MYRRVASVRVPWKLCAPMAARTSYRCGTQPWHLASPKNYRGELEQHWQALSD